MKIMGVISLVLIVTASLWLAGGFGQLSGSSATFTDSLADFGSIGTSDNFPPVNAAVNITPAPLELGSGGGPVQASIQIAALDVNDIDSQVTLCLEVGGCTLSDSGTVVGSAFEAEFDRATVNSFLAGQTGLLVFTVSGTAAGRSFEGADAIEVTAPPPPPPESP